MSRELIEEMTLIMCKYFRKDCCRCPDCVAKDQAEALVNAGYRKQSEWISVEERLPEKDGQYLVWVVTPNRGCVEEVQMEWFRNCDRYYNYMWKNHYTHWMPLPEPPKMKGGAE